MSDQHPNGEDVARMLREQGRVQAPSDLADEVMRQVRAEPREQPRPARRFRLPRLRPVLIPALGLAAAAGLVIGIAHLGSMSGSSSSAGGGATEASGGGGGGAAHAPSKQAIAAAPERTFAIPAGSAKTLSIYGPLIPPAASGTPTGSEPNVVTGGESHYTLTLRGTQYDQALARLRRLSAERRRHEPTVVVILRRKP